MEVVSQKQVQKDGLGFVLGVKRYSSKTLHVNGSSLIKDFEQLVNSTKNVYLNCNDIRTCGKNKFSHWEDP